MKNEFFFAFVGLFLVIFPTIACSSGGEISLTADKAALTEKGSDALFSIDVVDAPEEGYDANAFKVRVTPDGADPIDVTCTLTDVNGNTKLDKGDKVTCVEPADNKLGPALAGTEVDVELIATASGDEKTIGDATWTVQK